MPQRVSRLEEEFRGGLEQSASREKTAVLGGCKRLLRLSTVAALGGPLWVALSHLSAEWSLWGSMEEASADVLSRQ